MKHVSIAVAALWAAAAAAAADSGSCVIATGVECRDFAKLTPSARDGRTHLKSTGTGFFVGGRGEVLTNWHVVENAHETAAVWNGTAYRMRVKAKNSKTDLALLEMDGLPVEIRGNTIDFAGLKRPVFPVLGVAACACDPGDEIYVVGYPQIEIQGIEPKVTRGIVSSKTGFKGEKENFQMDAAIQGGNSGGPVVDARGHVVGVAVASLANSQNANYAITLEEIVDFTSGRIAVERMPKMPHSRVAMLKRVKQSTVVLLNYAKGAPPFVFDRETAGERERNETRAAVEKAVIRAKLLKLRKEWKELKELTDRIIADFGAVEDVKEMNDTAREMLGEHLVVIAVVDKHEVDAKITPVCGIKESSVQCEKAFAVHCEGKERGFPVKATLDYVEDGKHWRGELDVVYDWRGTKTVWVELDKRMQ